MILSVVVVTGYCLLLDEAHWAHGTLEVTVISTDTGVLG